MVEKCMMGFEGIAQSNSIQHCFWKTSFFVFMVFNPFAYFDIFENLSEGL